MSFSESKQNLQYLSIQHYTLNQLGINLDCLKGKDLIQNYWRFAIAIGISIYLKYGLVYLALNSFDRIAVATASLSMFNQGCLIVVKMSTFLYNGDEFLRLIWEMNKLADKAKDNSEEYKKWLSENRLSLLTGKLYFYSCWTAVTSAGIMPLCFMAYEYYSGKGFVRRSAFEVKFPFDNGSLTFYIVNYILCLVYIIILSNMTVSMDSLFGWYIFNISAHFRILRMKFENTALKLGAGNHEDFVRDMGVIVRYHNRILKFTEILNNMYAFILWAEVSFSCLQMCFAIFTLSNDDDLSNLPFNVMVFITIFLQLVIYCFGGEKLKNENDDLCEDIYLNFPWEKMSPIERKSMLLPLMRSQKELKLTGLIFSLDRNLLVYILKTAFSYNALLSAMKE